VSDLAPDVLPSPADPSPADPSPADPSPADPSPADLPPADLSQPAAPAASDLLQRLAAEPWSWSFYQAMRRLEARFADRPRFGQSGRPAQDAIRFGQEPSVVFAPATLAAWETGQGGRADRMLVHFFGLFGPDGPLPLHLTEYARDRRRNFRDPTFQRFADVFHHRLLSLFYRAWANSRPTVSFDRPQQDRFSLYVGALMGLGTEFVRHRDAMPDLTKLHFAGHLSGQTRHAEGLAAILSAFFHMPVRIDSFIGAWLVLEARDRTRLGESPRTAGLGTTAVLGGRVWSRQHKFRLVFGPLSLPEYLRLLPGGSSFHRLIPVVRNYVGDVLVWDVNLILKAAEVPKLQLGRQGRLGWTTWLVPRRKSADAADLFLDASADSMARNVDAKSSPGSHRA
jgi:type VI secretion system protein ImpH